MTIYLLPFQVAAVFCDLYQRKIPNTLITAGMITGAAYQWSAKGPPGLLAFAGGVLLPLLLLGILHYFRMLGAGDIKLLMMSGGFFGTAGSLKCICLSFLAAGALSLAVLVKHRILRRRLNYFVQYIINFRQGGKWTPYIQEREDPAYLHFSIPVLIGSLPLTGGFL